MCFEQIRRRREASPQGFDLRHQDLFCFIKLELRNEADILAILGGENDIFLGGDGGGVLVDKLRIKDDSRSVGII